MFTKLFAMLRILFFAQVALQLSFNIHLAESAQLNKRNPWEVPPLKRIGDVEKETDAEVAAAEETVVESSYIFNGHKVMNAEECDKEYVIDDNEAVIFYSSFKPYSYMCERNFTHSKNSELHLLCPSVYLRFNCLFESLVIEDGNGTFRFCRTDEVPPLSSTFFSVKYESRLYGLHGGFVCSISSIFNSRNVILQTQNEEQTEFIDYQNCGEVSGVTRSAALSLERKKRNTAFLQTKIVGGVDAKRGDYPWMASLAIFVEDGADSNVYSCGGSLISDTIVITASHCLEMENIALVEVGLGLNNAEADAEWLASERFHLHEEYDKYTIINDIAIIYLEQKVTFNNFIQPICLPTEKLRNLAGLTATATGWGRTSFTGDPSDTLQTVDLSLWSTDQCNSAWKTEYPYAKEEILPNQLCAYGSNKDTCSGDSGGPLAIKLSDRWILVGITSYGYGCATPGLPGVYTRVSSYHSWLTDLME